MKFLKLILIHGILLLRILYPEINVSNGTKHQPSV